MLNLLGQKRLTIKCSQVNWNDPIPSWSKHNWACGLWQFSSHFYPLLYSALLTAVAYHAFLTLFIDYSGSYEERCKKVFPLIFSAMIVVVGLVVAPAGFFAKSRFNIFIHFSSDLVKHFWSNGTRITYIFFYYRGHL
jgi:hypothetical protein